jgi:hypothetical protein
MFPIWEQPGTCGSSQPQPSQFWLEPEVALAHNYELSTRQLSTALRLLREHEDEIRAAWKAHFGR